MSSDEWGILIGAAITLAVTVTPWMFAVHSKLAVIAEAVKPMRAQIDAHEQRLDSHDRKFDDHARKIGRLEASTQ